MSDIVLALRPLAVVFGELAIEYYVGGSVASSAQGVARATLDVDIVVALKPKHVDSFVEALEVEYYVDLDVVKDAVLGQKSFNLIHLETMMKVDVFVLKSASWDLEAFGRRRFDSIVAGENAELFPLATPEDLVLHKLHWYQLGGGLSERQWGDVMGVLRVQRGAIDDEYLDRWSQSLGVTRLLAKARDELGLTNESK